MENFSCQVLSLDFTFLKNTNHGHLDFATDDCFLYDEEDNGKVFGVYGQNGSGKSTMILAFSILNRLFRHLPLGEETDLGLSKWSKTSTITLKMGIVWKEVHYLVDYHVILAKEENGSSFVSHESLEGRILQDKPKKFGCTYSIGQAGDPVTVFGGDTDLKALAKSLLVEISKALGSNFVRKTSVIFDDRLNQLIKNKNNEDLTALETLVSLVSYFAVSSFIVVGSHDQGLIDGFGILPLRIRRKDRNHGEIGSIPIHLFETNSVDRHQYELVKEVIEQFNVVVPAFLPGMKLGVENVQDSAAPKSNSEAVYFQIVSYVNGYPIPLRSESDGTKRIISICSSLFACYSDDAVVLCIDEFDAGIFEYLFGEIVEVMSKGCEGQLFFTSHNLRPLEILAPKSLILTTTDSDNRYVFFKGVKATNNPRDVYLRNALLNKDNGILYRQTNEYEISKAFMKIGDYYYGS
jgi:hypothetical protein